MEKRTGTTSAGVPGSLKWLPMWNRSSKWPVRASLAERSVSRAAVRMNQTQPAISAALRRLREVLGDPILVRERGGMVPTERARQLRDRARTALAEIAHMLVGPEVFDPATNAQTFSFCARPSCLWPAPNVHRPHPRASRPPPRWPP